MAEWTDAYRRMLNERLDRFGEPLARRATSEG
jgi:hypothetical protein